jgi:hypothetical protein
MVISESFIWLHIPKTAGDATLSMFQQLGHRFRVLDEHTDPRKHGTLAEAHARAPGSAALPVIANLRRLPELVLSYFHHMQRHEPEQMFAELGPFGALSFEEYLGYVLSHPGSQSHDWLLDHYLGDREADHWLRVSDLAESFLDVIGLYLPIPPEARARIRAARANVGAYAKGDLGAWFTGPQLEALYRNCPRWSKIERRSYGGLLSDRPAEPR